MRRFVYICALVLPLFACDSLPVSSADIPLTPEQSAAISDAVSAPPPVWVGAFQDTLMDRLLQQLNTQNLDIQMAQARLQEARAHVAFSRADFFPRVDISSSATRGNDRPGAGTATTLNKGGFDAAWELDLFGRIRAQTDAADARREGEAERLDSVRITMQAELIRAVVEWRQAQETLKQASALLASQDEQVEVFSIRVKAGLVDATYLERASAQRAQTATLIPQAQTQATAAQFQIEQLLGQPPGSLAAILEESQGTALNVPAVEGTIAVALEVIRARPDVKAAGAELREAQANIAQAEASLWPQISLGSFLGVQSASDALRMADNPLWSVSSAISAPLLNFGKLRAAINVADARAEIARLNYERTVSLALQEAHTSLSDYLGGMNVISAQQEALQHRQDTVKLARQRFERGLTDMTDLTTAQAELDSATITLVERKAQAAIAYIRLQKALGN